MARKKKPQQPKENMNNHFELKYVVPLTANQQKTFDAYSAGYNLMLHGYAGTGKTYISLYLALRQILQESKPGIKYNKIMIVRSAVPSRDMGFMPGSMKEKARVYEEPYKEICDDLFGRGDGYEILKTKKLVDFTTTSYLRGMTFNNAIVIVDETANMLFQELDTVMTRIGDNSKVIFCGDYRQTDLCGREKEGITQFMRITKNINSFRNIEFTKEDICRSGIVKDYIITKTEMNL